MYTTRVYYYTFFELILFLFFYEPFSKLLFEKKGFQKIRELECSDKEGILLRLVFKFRFVCILVVDS